MKDLFNVAIREAMIPLMRISSSAFGLILLLPLLAGCTAPRHVGWSDTFEASKVSEATVILSASGWHVRGGFDPGQNTDLANALHAAVLETLPLRADAFDSALTVRVPGEDVDSLAASVYAEMILDVQSALQKSEVIRVPIPEALVELTEEANTPHVMLVRTAGWSATTGERVGIAAAAVAATLLIPGGVVIPTGSMQGMGLEIVLIDAEEGAVAWYGQQYTDLDPTRDDHIDALVTSLLLQLYTGEHIPAADLTGWPTNVHMSAFLHGGSRVSGYLDGREGLDVHIRQRDGEIETVCLTTVRSIRGATGGRYYPARRGSQRTAPLF